MKSPLLLTVKLEILFKVRASVWNESSKANVVQSTITIALNYANISAFFQILLKAGAIPCNKFLSADSYSKIYFCLVIMGLSVVYGVWTAVIYIRSPEVKLRQNAVTRNTDEYNEIWNYRWQGTDQCPKIKVSVTTPFFISISK